MKLKAILDTLEGLAEHFHPLYEQRDGKYMLTGVEGMVTEADVARATRALNQEKEQHKETKKRLSAYGELQPEEVRTALEEYQVLKEKGAGDEERVTKLAEQRAARLTAELNRKLDDTTRQLTEVKEREANFARELENRALEDVVRAEIKAIPGLQPDVVNDAIILARANLKRAEDGVFVDGNGISAKDWLIKTAEARPYWFQPSQGGGANGGRGGSREPNPFTKEHWNVTAQAKLASNPAEFDRFAKAAGVDPANPRKPA